MTAYIQIKGIKQLSAKINKVKKDLPPNIKVNKQATVIIDKWIQDNFKQDGKLAHPGVGWKKLHPATVLGRRKGKKKLIGGKVSSGKIKGKLAQAKILRDTGQLKSRWGHYWSKYQARVSSKVKYGLFHHEGKGHLPERRILPSEKQIYPKLKKLFIYWIKKGLK